MRQKKRQRSKEVKKQGKSQEALQEKEQRRTAADYFPACSRLRETPMILAAQHGGHSIWIKWAATVWHKLST